jgi:hypothetical protein
VPALSSNDAKVRTAVVIPVGPGEQADDTVRSVLHHIQEPRAIVLVDDTKGDPDLRATARLSSDIEVVASPPGAIGVRGGLWVRLARAFAHVAETYDFDLLLRMDADALVIGDGLEDQALARFAADSRVGMLGTYRLGPDGGERSFDVVAKLLRREIGVLGLRHRRERAALRRVLYDARANGYTDGEHPLGGAFLLAPLVVRAMHRNGWLNLPLERTRLSEDHLFALLTVAAGYRIADWGGPDHPLALRWRGLPAHPQELLDRGKLVTHSVKFWEDLDEAAIRAEFAAAREAG